MLKLALVILTFLFCSVSSSFASDLVTVLRVPGYDYSSTIGQWTRNNSWRYAAEVPNEMLGIVDFYKDAQWRWNLPNRQVAGLVPRTYEMVASPVGKVAIRRGLARVAGVAWVGIGIAMAAKDIYDWAHESDTNMAYFNGIAPGGSPDYSNVQVGDNILLPDGAYGLVDGITVVTNSLKNFYSTDTIYYQPNGFGSGKLNVGITRQSGSSTYWTSWKAINFGPGVAPPIPNAASGDLTSFQTALENNFNQAEGSKSFPNAEAGIDQMIKQKMENTPGTGNMQVAPTAGDLAQTSSDYTSAQQSTNIQKQYSTVKALYSSGGATQQQMDEMQRLKDAIDAQQAAEAAQRAADESATMPETKPDALKNIDWSPLLALKGIVASAFPFSLLSTVASYVSDLVRDPVAPSFILPLPFEQQVLIDLAVFDPVAAVLRWIFALAMSIGSVFLVNSFFRGN